MKSCNEPLPLSDGGRFVPLNRAELGLKASSSGVRLHAMENPPPPGGPL